MDRPLRGPLRGSCPQAAHRGLDSALRALTTVLGTTRLCLWVAPTAHSRDVNDITESENQSVRCASYSRTINQPRMPDERRGLHEVSDTPQPRRCWSLPNPLSIDVH